ncbi:MAG: hypothetical protein V5A79_05110 [Candidatus Bipolaricaulota bacterium]
MTKENGEWELDEVKKFIWNHLCKSEEGRFDFAPLLIDEGKKAPSGQEFARVIDWMKDNGYVTDSRPDYQHYWVELKENGSTKCKNKV